MIARSPLDKRRSWVEVRCLISSHQHLLSLDEAGRKKFRHRFRSQNMITLHSTGRESALYIFQVRTEQLLQLLATPM